MQLSCFGDLINMEPQKEYAHHQPLLQPILLQPYPYQVSGCSIVLMYDNTTLCKPLMGREYDFYQRMPDILKQFTPRYEGVTEVIVHRNENGLAQIYGLTNNVYPTKEKLESKSEEVKKAFQRLLESILEEQSSSSILKGRNRNVTRDLEECMPEETLRRAFNPWTEEVLSRLVKRLPKSNYATRTFLVLENIAAKFKQPCILDLKMGVRQHHDAATQAKVRLAKDRIASTTSIVLGSRLTGMQIYRPEEQTYTFLDKFKGRSLSYDEYISTLRFFFGSCQSLRIEILQECISRLLSLMECIHTVEEYRFYSSSLLIVYEACSPEVKVDIRMIDFANITAASSDLDSDCCDQGIVFGLKNLICLFNGFCDDFRGEKIA